MSPREGSREKTTRNWQNFTPATQNTANGGQPSFSKNCRSRKNTGSHLFDEREPKRAVQCLQVDFWESWGPEIVHELGPLKRAKNGRNYPV